MSVVVNSPEAMHMPAAMRAKRSVLPPLYSCSPDGVRAPRDGAPSTFLSSATVVIVPALLGQAQREQRLGDPLEGGIELGHAGSRDVEPAIVGRGAVLQRGIGCTG